MLTIHRPEYIELITRLRNARKFRHITQSQLANSLNKPQSYVSKIETCERRLDLIEAIEWCRALGISLYDVLPIEFKFSNERAQTNLPFPKPTQGE